MDTGPLYAILDNRDQWHAQAVSSFEKIEREGLEIVLPYPAALELHRLAITRKRLSVQTVHQSVEGFLDAFIVTLPTEEDVEGARDILKRYDDQKISLTDATIASMAKREEARILTLDKEHFFGLMEAELYNA